MKLGGVGAPGVAGRGCGLWAPTAAGRAGLACSVLRGWVDQPLEVGGACVWLLRALGSWAVARGDSGLVGLVVWPRLVRSWLRSGAVVGAALSCLWP